MGKDEPDIGHKKVNSLALKTLQHRRTKEAAQSLVEFALMLPLMLLTCLGIAEIGRAAFISMTIGNAATAGAEYGSQDSTTAKKNDEIKSAALNDANYSGLTTSNIVINHYCACDPVTGTGAGTSCKLASGSTGTDCTTIDCGTGQIVECIKVTTHVDFTPLFHYPLLPSSFQSNGSATMRVRH